MLVGVILIILTASRTSKNIFARLGGGFTAVYNASSGYLSDVKYPIPACWHWGLQPA